MSFVLAIILAYLFFFILATLVLMAVVPVSTPGTAIDCAPENGKEKLRTCSLEGSRAIYPAALAEVALRKSSCTVSKYESE